MLVIVASRYDDSARELARRWDDAAVLTPEDLSRPGWRFVSGRAQDSTAVVAGAVVSARRIRGVLTRLLSVSPEELPHIVPEERNYVATEMTAFLTAWLSELPCRVMNRPTALCLAGPAWRREQWVRAAAAAGLDIVPVVRCVPPALLGESAEWMNGLPNGIAVPVIAGQYRSLSLAPNFVAGLRRLAMSAGAELFRVHLTSLGSDARFVSADLWPDLSCEDVAAAVRDQLLAPVSEAR